MFKLIDKKIIILLHSTSLLNWTYASLVLDNFLNLQNWLWFLKIVPWKLLFSPLQAITVHIEETIQVSAILVFVTRIETWKLCTSLDFSWSIYQSSVSETISSDKRSINILDTFYKENVGTLIWHQENPKMYKSKFVNGRGRKTGGVNILKVFLEWCVLELATYTRLRTTVLK